MVDQCAAIQNRHRLDAGRQGLAHFVQPLACGLCDRTAVAAGDHQSRAQNRFVAVTAGAAQTRCLTDFHRGDVSDPHDQTAAIDNRRLSQILDRRGQGAGAHRQRLAAPLHIARTRLRIGSIQRLDQVVETEAIGRQPRRVRANGIFLHIAADGVDPRQPLGGSHLRRNDPVLNRSEIGGPRLRRGQQVAFRRQIGSVGLPSRLPWLGQIGGGERLVIDRPHQDFAEPRGDRGQVRLAALRQAFARLSHPFRHLLAGEIDVGLVGEDDRDLAEAVAAQRPRALQAGDAGHRGFQRIGDLPLDLLGRQGRGDRGDLHLPVGDVRHGVDRQPGQLEQAHRGDQSRRQDHEPAKADG
ncbi:hypothetical protein D3C85_574660 [compost metagenome]